MMYHLYILLTILFTVYGQIIIKWQINLSAAIPSEMIGKIYFFLRLLINPWILSAFIAAFLASLSWMAALTKFTLSYAYPFMSLTFILVIFLSSILFKEAITISKTISLGLIIAGLIIGTRYN
ncbi:MAG: hypothetical protein V7K60_26810 [Nostoc sp.]